MEMQVQRESARIWVAFYREPIQAAVSASMKIQIQHSTHPLLGLHLYGLPSNMILNRDVSATHIPARLARPPQERRRRLYRGISLIRNTHPPRTPLGP